ncbi:restriction endonuclease subunit M [Rhodopseudomonas palustris]|uniref:site-specific DNA-methyltransferase (adenine-specific) n=1 Tax=Rhodopseudomonas palustris TaxID=1076 RepID=A0A323UKQ5_RHOPL|nr:DNA methyltransferase [Rhodopseudomonas palustris]PZA12991.1 restriction endonuclease subunit M [Rhodopseudomonas palustris]
MFDDSRSFISRAFLRSEFSLDYSAYSDETDSALLRKLHEWDRRLQLSETQAEGAFTQVFFVETWGYGEAGRVPAEHHTIIPKLPIPGEGAGGGAGEADLALGWFRGRKDAIPQVLCEFKDIRSKLDAKQKRKGSNRTPIEQCLNYVRGARRGLFGNEPVQPWWGLVTDMNEFRLYWWDRAPAEYIRFFIRREDLLSGSYDLLSETEDARFDRYLFSRIFSREMLLSEAGRPQLLRLIERQWTRGRKLEGEFYEHYRAVREALYNALRTYNADFPGRPGELLRVTQKLLDRFIFAFFCEDMGERLMFPPQLIRDFMRNRSNEPFYDEGGTELWDQFKRVFDKMNTGGALNRVTLPEINGGLFARDPLIDGLTIPNHVFAKAGQGASETSLESDKNTLLYLSGRYNYAARGDVKESLSLFTLGHIFEQSITELEYREGELEGRETIAKLSKRKRDGVYYTPEPVVNYLVEQTLGPWFADAKAACGYPAPDAGAPTPAAISAYIERLAQIRIVDPACGSGAFLISAFRRLLTERVSAAADLDRARSGTASAVDEAPIIADILRNNIYGVDINPASVEITKLALWLHSARAAAPLSSLEHTIRIGNSLVGEDFWIGRQRSAEAEERVRTFDWRTAFPEIWPAGEDGGFHIVLGNPPYVKLQNMTKVNPDVVAYLSAEREEDTYRSARTGNFDLYLPFIEKGLRLLAWRGRMAYIAPSLWVVNQYGEGLRGVVRRGRHLDRWLDFKSHQIFEDVITYTALQFFTREPCEAARFLAAPDGEIANADWSAPGLSVSYNSIPDDREWLIATGAERSLIERLSRDCLRLDSRDLSRIVVGIQTSGNHIYHLQRVGPGQYRCAPKGDRAGAYEVEIEDSIMKPLVSGAEAKRYEEPETNTYLLFPYEADEHGKMTLLSVDEMEKRFPKAWSYLLSWKDALTNGDTERPDDWWGYVYRKNLDKQHLPKLIVAQTVPGMRVCSDSFGRYYLDNVRVNGILPARDIEHSFLLGALNGPIVDFVFRRISKPKQGGWFEANKQFIAPLPIPNAPPNERAEVSERAERLQQRWTQRRLLLREASERLSVLARQRHPTRWLWPDLPELREMIERAPKGLRLAADRRKWAGEQLTEMEATRTEALQAALDRGGLRQARFDRGELRLYVSGAAVLGKIFLGEAEGPLAEAYWRWLLLSGPAREATRFAADLRQPPAPSEEPAAMQFIDRVAALSDEVAGSRLTSAR